MNIPKLHIGHLTADIPIIQGGMGVRVSLASLEAAAGRGSRRQARARVHRAGGQALRTPLRTAHG